MVRFDSVDISDYQHPEAVVANILLKLIHIVYLEMIRDIHRV